MTDSHIKYFRLKYLERRFVQMIDSLAKYDGRTGLSFINEDKRHNLNHHAAINNL